MSYAVSVTEKGQTTIPAYYRVRHQIKAGQQVIFSENEAGQLIVEPAPDLDSLRQKAMQDLASRGFTKEKIHKIAQNYKSGDGFGAHVKEKYGNRSQS
jgi:AbrB family looped-hinge helix DNA binding protein